MRICIYEDRGVELLEPLTLTRPAFALWCGARTMLERQRAALGADETGLWVRPELVELCRVQYPNMPVNDAAWLRQGPVVLVNARWLPGEATLPSVGGAGLARGKLAYLAHPPGEALPDDLEAFDAWLAVWRDRLPQHDVGGLLLDYLWDYVDHNGEFVCRDEGWFRDHRACRPLPDQVAVVGPNERMLLADDAAVEPFVTADTRHGPVLIDRPAVVHSFTPVAGPCYLGRETQAF